MSSPACYPQAPWALHGLCGGERGARDAVRQVEGRARRRPGGGPPGRRRAGCVQRLHCAITPPFPNAQPPRAQARAAGDAAGLQAGHLRQLRSCRQSTPASALNPRIGRCIPIRAERPSRRRRTKQLVQTPRGGGARTPGQHDAAKSPTTRTTPPTAPTVSGQEAGMCLSAAATPGFMSRESQSARPLREGCRSRVRPSHNPRSAGQAKTTARPDHADPTSFWL